MLVPKCKSAGGSGSMLPPEILNLRSSEIVGNEYFCICFTSSNLSMSATKLHEKGHFVRVFQKLGGDVPPVPSAPTPIEKSSIISHLSMVLRVCSSRFTACIFICLYFSICAVG